MKAQQDAEANALAADRARQAEEAARQKADENARVAVEQTDLALDSLSVLVTKVQQRLTEEKGMDELRRDLLQTALDGLVRVVRSNDRSGLMGRAEASAQLQMGQIMLRLGQAAEATKHYERAHKAALALLEAEPDGDKSRGNLAVIINTLGQLQLVRDPAKAREHFLRAIELQEDLVVKLKGQDLIPASTQRNLAGFYDSLGSANQRLGDPAAARDVFLKALRIRERLATDQNPDAELQDALARSFKLLGDLSFSLGDPESALTYLQRSANLREAIAKSNPKLSRHARSFASAVAAVGDLHLRQRRDADALASYTRSLELSQELAKLDPVSNDPRRDLALMHYRYATATLRLGEADATREHFQRCLALREQVGTAEPNGLSKQIDLMVALARCGRTDDAAKLAVELQARSTKDTNTPFQIGCCYAICSATAGGVQPGSEPSADVIVMRQAFAAKAVELLRLAVARGYRDLPSLSTDPDLDSIREHPEYKLLVKEMESTTRQVEPQKK